MALTRANYLYALKERYPHSEIFNATLRDNPLWAMMPKDTQFTGKVRVVPVNFGRTQGRSATFATAQAQKGNHTGASFNLTHVSDYALCSIDGLTMKISKGNPAAFMDAAEKEMESATDALKSSLGESLYRDGTGAIARRASASTNVITLTNPSDAYLFEIGETVVAGATASGALRAGSTTVTGVNEDAGTITLASAAAITGFADNDFLKKAGDHNLKLSGVLAWIPPTAPSGGDNFFGVDRSQHVTRLAGHRLNIASQPYAEGLVRACNRVGKTKGAAVTHIFMGVEHVENLINEIGAKVDRVEKEIATIGFEGVRIRHAKGVAEVYGDPSCPPEYAFGLQLDSWNFCSAGKAPDFLDEDGLTMRAEVNADGYEVRLGYYGQVECKRPWTNFVATLPSLT